MARALFLNDLPACQPYEWYTWQMDKLEKLVLKYESFACVQGPLACAAVAVGVFLLLTQLVCCPLLLLGRWGMRRALLVLFATDEELEMALLNEEDEDEEDEDPEMDASAAKSAKVDSQKSSPPSSEGSPPDHDQVDLLQQRHGASKPIWLR